MKNKANYNINVNLGSLSPREEYQEILKLDKDLQLRQKRFHLYLYMLRYNQKRSYAEINEMTGYAPKSAKTIVSRVRKALERGEK